LTTSIATLDRPLLSDKHCSVAFSVPESVLFALVQNSVVIRLGNASKLAVVDLGPHHADMVHLFHRGRYAKAKNRKIHAHFQFISSS
jgi:hypothetical protein